MKLPEIEFFRKLDCLPSYPWQVIKALDAVERSSSMDYSLVELIQNDATVVGRVLKIANEPLYGYAGQIASIQQATGLLGPGIIKKIVLTTPILESFRTGETDADFGIDYSRLGVHLVITGMVSRWIGNLQTDIETDVCFTAGLIHGLGKMAMAAFFPEFFVKRLELSEKENISLEEAETKSAGFSNQEAGLEMARAWGYPDKLATVFDYLVTRGGSHGKDKLSNVVFLSKYLAHKLGYGDGAGPKPEAPSDEVYSCAGVSKNQLMESWADLKTSAETAIRDMA